MLTAPPLNLALIEKARVLCEAQAGASMSAVLAHGSRYGGVPRKESDLDLLIVARAPSGHMKSVFRGEVSAGGETVAVEARFYEATDFFNEAGCSKIWPDFMTRIVAGAHVLWAHDCAAVEAVIQTSSEDCAARIQSIVNTWQKINFDDELMLFLHEHRELVDICLDAVELNPLAAMVRFADLVHWVCLDVLRLKAVQVLTNKAECGEAGMQEAATLAKAYFVADCLRPVRYLNPTRYPIHPILSELLNQVDSLFRVESLSKASIEKAQRIFEAHVGCLLNIDLYGMPLREVLVCEV